MVRRDARDAREAKEKPSAVRLEAFKQTRLCKFHIAGNCIRGTSCNFAHSMEQIRDQPDFSKTRLCVDYCTDQWCRDGDYCKFAHGEHELRPHPASNGPKKEHEKEAEMQVTQVTQVTQDCKSPQVSPKGKQLKNPESGQVTQVSSKSLFKSPAWFEEGCWFGPEAMPMYPWLAFVEYQFADDFGWDSNSQLSGDWNEWNEWNEWNRN